jgi:hypothetical protein
MSQDAGCRCSGGGEDLGGSWQGRRCGVLCAGSDPSCFCSLVPQVVGVAEVVRAQTGWCSTSEPPVSVPPLLMPLRAVGGVRARRPDSAPCGSTSAQPAGGMCRMWSGGLEPPTEAIPALWPRLASPRSALAWPCSHDLPSRPQGASMHHDACPGDAANAGGRCQAESKL